MRLAESDLGSILVDADGMTLYLFEADTDGSSTCYDDCAASWPALIDDAPSAGAGVDESLLGTTERDDGEVQVTYGGQPLYSFASDQAPGDVEARASATCGSWSMPRAMPSSRKPGDPVTETAVAPRLRRPRARTRQRCGPPHRLGERAQEDLGRRQVRRQRHPMDVAYLQQRLDVGLVGV